MHKQYMKSTIHTATRPQEEFLRQVLFMKDDDKILAVFPFYHDISVIEYNTVIENFFFDMDVIPQKNEFCLMHESNFGWGWIHNRMFTHLDVASKEDYVDFKNVLLKNKLIKDSFILNEE